MVANIPGDSPQIKLINEWSRGFTEANLAILEKYAHKDFRKFTYPESIGQPVMNREEWFEHTAGYLKVSKGYEGTLYSIIDAPNLGKVIIHATFEIKNPQGLKAIRESIFVYTVVDDDGSLKVKQSEEFTDAKGFSDFAKVVNTSQ